MASYEVRTGGRYRGMNHGFNMAENTKTAVIKAPECPVCLENMSPPIFQCQTGHSLCSVCTSNLVPPVCPICRLNMTQMRNWQLEEIVSKAKIPCENKQSGCVYTVAAAEMNDHLKECIFRRMDCPLGLVFGKCSWSGNLNEMLNHFKERHAANCNVNTDSDQTITNVRVGEDDRHMYLVPQGKLLFVLTFKIDTIQNMAYWAIQHIGSKSVAHQHIYEIHVTSRQDNRRKVVYTEHCFNDAMKVDEVFRLGKCAVMPLGALSNFIKDKQLSFRFFIKRLPGPPKNKNNGDDNGSNGPKGPKPHTSGKGPGKGPGGPKGPNQKKFAKNV